jgi:hypothetical protein
MARVARGWIAGTFATGIAALSHGLADGSAPSAVALGTALVFAGVLGTFGLGRRPSLPRLAVVVAGSQLAFHLVFSGLTPGTATSTGHHGTPALLDPAVAHHGTDPVMWIAHAVALLATLVFLRRAELALWGLIRQTVHEVVEVGRRVPVVSAAPRVSRLPSPTWIQPPVAEVILATLRGRGPPVALGA